MINTSTMNEQNKCISSKKIFCTNSVLFISHLVSKTILFFKIEHRYKELSKSIYYNVYNHSL